MLHYYDSEAGEFQHNVNKLLIANSKASPENFYFSSKMADYKSKMKRVHDEMMRRSPSSGLEKADSIATQVQHLIGEAETEEAIDLLLSYLKQSNYRASYEEVLLQSSRWNRNEKQVKLGVLDDNLANKERNKINHALLKVVKKFH